VREIIMVVAAALGGSMWSLKNTDTPTWRHVAIFLGRIVVTSICITWALSDILMSTLGVAPIPALCLISFCVGAIGDGWTKIFTSMVDGISARFKKQGDEDYDKFT
jgi:hypothetical protein